MSASRAIEQPTAGRAGEMPLQFGKYQLNRLLARGGMGEVYLARLVGELGFEKRLVIKTILPEFAAKPLFIEMFAAEAKTAVALSHGNIVPTYELGRAGDTFYIVMGYVDGPSVAQLLSAWRRAGREPVIPVALHIIRGVLTGLAYAHRDEPGRPAVVHRDISPRNVLLDRSGQVRIVDFGIATRARAQVEVRAGSVGYIAPEQARGEAADPRADVFSTACLLYALTTGTAAFPHEGVWTTPDLSGVPPELRPPLAAALSLEVAGRPADATAFLRLLGPALAKYAATFGDPELAAHLEEVFPEGYSAESQPAASGRTRLFSGPGQTFATRLTVVPAAGAPADRPEPPPPRDDADPPAVEPSRDHSPLPLRHLLVVLAGASLLVGAAAFGLAQGLSSPRASSLRSFGAEAMPVVGVDLPSSPDPAPLPSWQSLASMDRPDVPRRAFVQHDVVPAGEAWLAPPPARRPPSAATASGRGRTRQAETPRPTEDTANGPSREAGFLKVSAPSVPWAEVYVDGKKQGHTPTPALSLPAGRHRLEVRCVPDVCDAPTLLFARPVTVTAGKTTAVDADEAPAVAHGSPGERAVRGVPRAR